MQNGKKESWWGRLWNRAPDPMTRRLQEAEGRVKRARDTARLSSLERQERQLKEAAAIWPNWSWTSDFNDVMTAAGDYIFPISGWADRTTVGLGHNYPFFQTEQQLAFLRSFSRLVVGQNQFATGLLTGLTSYVIGEGLTYRVTSKDNAAKDLVARVQDVIDKFLDKADWWRVEREAFWRSRRDGEFFLRYFGRGQWRFVEPEQVRESSGAGIRQEWSYGVHTDPDDVVSVSEYNVCYDYQTDCEVVPAAEIVHYKVNVDSTVKRGMPDFSFGTREILESSTKLIRNMAEGSAIQAAVAEIQQYEQATESQAQGFSDDNAMFNRVNQITGKKENVEKIQPGTIRRIPKGTTYVPPPYGQGAQIHLQVFDACLRSAAVRWNAPEWLVSSNASNMAAYVASLVAVAPFVKTGKCIQKENVQVHLRCIWMVLDEAILAGRLPPDTRRLVDVQVEGPQIESRDAVQEASASQIYVGLGVKSRQTVAQEQGLDWEQEQVNIEEYQERTGGKPGAELPDSAQPEPGLPGLPGLPEQGGGLAEAQGDAAGRKIAKLRDEGKPEDQAVAIALSMQRRGELAEDDDDPGDGRGVAQGYADDWNELVADGDEVGVDELDEAAEALDGTGWALWWDHDTKKWVATELADDDGGNLLESVQLMEEAGVWAAYVGPRGGKGWKNSKTGTVKYGAKPSEGRQPKEKKDKGDLEKQEANAIAAIKADVDSQIRANPENARQIYAGAEQRFKAAKDATIKAKMGDVKAGAGKADEPQTFAEKMARVQVAEEMSGRSYVDRLVDGVIAHGALKPEHFAPGLADPKGRYNAALARSLQGTATAEDRGFVRVTRQNVLNDLKDGNTPKDVLGSVTRGIGDAGFGDLSPVQAVALAKGEQPEGDKPAESKTMPSAAKKTASPVTAAKRTIRGLIARKKLDSDEIVKRIDEIGDKLSKAEAVQLAEHFGLKTAKNATKARVLVNLEQKILKDRQGLAAAKKPAVGPSGDAQFGTPHAERLARLKTGVEVTGKKFEDRVLDQLVALKDDPKAKRLLARIHLPQAGRQPAAPSRPLTAEEEGYLKVTRQNVAKELRSGNVPASHLQHALASVGQYGELTPAEFEGYLARRKTRESIGEAKDEAGREHTGMGDGGGQFTAGSGGGGKDSDSETKMRKEPSPEAVANVKKNVARIMSQKGLTQVGAWQGLAAEWQDDAVMAAMPEEMLDVLGDALSKRDGEALGVVSDWVAEHTPFQELAAATRKWLVGAPPKWESDTFSDGGYEVTVTGYPGEKEISIKTGPKAKITRIKSGKIMMDFPADVESQLKKQGLDPANYVWIEGYPRNPIRKGALGILQKG